MSTPAGASTETSSSWSLPLTFVAVRLVVISAGHRRRIHARDVEIDPVQRVGRRRDEVVERLVEDERRVDREVGTDRACTGVEWRRRRNAVLLDDALGSRGHQRRLDHRRRPVGMRRLDERARRRPSAGSTSRCRRSPCRDCRAGRCRAVVWSGCGVVPASTWTPGAVTSGFRKSPIGPRDEKPPSRRAGRRRDALRPRRLHVGVGVDEGEQRASTAVDWIAGR